MKPPPLTVKTRTHSTTPQSIFRTLLWAESEPRYSVLRIIVLLLALHAAPSLRLLIDYFDPNVDFPLRTGHNSDMNSRLLAFAGVLYCAFSHGLQGINTRMSWRTMALPLKAHQLVLPAIVYQTGLALLLGTLWGLNRLDATFESPMAYPIQTTLVLSAQLQAALLWYGALGPVRGLSTYGFSLCLCGLCSMALRLTNTSHPEVYVTLILVFGGWASSFWAAKAMRGGRTPDLDWERLPGVESIRAWLRTRSAPDAFFASPFRAQLWFEWRRSGRWVPIAAAIALALTLSIDSIHYLFTGQTYSMSGGEDRPMMSPLIAVQILVPFLFWFIHITVTRPYRNFVFARPNTVRRVSHAKLLAALMAIAFLALLLMVDSLLYGTADGLEQTATSDSSFLNSVHLWAAGMVLNILMMTYGPMLLFAMIPEGFHQAISTYTPLPAGVETKLDLARMVYIFIPVLAVPVTVGAYLIHRIRRSTYPFPWEIVAASIIAMVFLGSYGYEVFVTQGSLGRILFTYAGPLLFLLSVAWYGCRVRVLDRKQLGMLSGLLGILLLLHTLTASADRLGNSTGYWLVLTAGLLVFYPMAIGTQRHESEREQLPRIPTWLLIFSPVLWGIYHLLGEVMPNGEEEG